MVHLRKSFFALSIFILLLSLISCVSNGFDSAESASDEEDSYLEEEEKEADMQEFVEEDFEDSLRDDFGFELIVSNTDLIFSGGFADPSVITLADGSYLMYLNRFDSSSSGTYILSSSDAINWVDQTDIVFNGVATARAYNFGDRIAVYYPREESTVPPPPGEEPEKNIYVEYSLDGISDWTEPELLLSPREEYSFHGPTIIQLADGSYKMFFDEHDLSTAGEGGVLESEIFSASSVDGLSWQRDEEVVLVWDSAVEGKGHEGIAQLLHPFVLPLFDADGVAMGYLMFYNSHSEVFAAYSSDALTWQKMGSLGIDGADVDVVEVSQGRYRLFYGNFAPETLGVVYAADLEIVYN